jgi:hypothetical protein
MLVLGGLLCALNTLRDSDHLMGLISLAVTLPCPVALVVS